MLENDLEKTQSIPDEQEAANKLLEHLNCILHQTLIWWILVQNGKFKEPDGEFTRSVNRQLKMEFNSPSADQDLHNDFLTNEVMAAIKTVKAGKAPGPDNLHPEFFLHLDDKCFEWLWIQFSKCLSKKKLPIVWKIAKVIAALKLNKPVVSLRRSKFSTQLLHPWLISPPYWRHWGIIRQDTHSWCCVCQSFSCIWHCLASWLDSKVAKNNP